MDINKIENGLDNSNLIKNVIYFKEIPSTNDYAKIEKLEDKTLLISDIQTKGRGKNQSLWYSDSRNIEMTIFLKPNCNIEKLEGLTILVAEKIQMVIKKLYNIDLKVKKPNDLLLNNKKICGILTETILEGSLVKKLIIGIGFNVNQENIPKEIENIATSLKMQTNKEYSLEKIIVEICGELEVITYDDQSTN